MRCFSEKFNKKGFKTVALWKRFNGEKTGKRRKTIPWRRRGRLDYIFFCRYLLMKVLMSQKSIKLFFWRPTESPIIFVQQLGRGPEKPRIRSFLVVLDFIANYQNNYLIPVALSGDNSYDKDVMRKVVGLGTRMLSQGDFESQKTTRFWREPIFK